MFLVSFLSAYLTHVCLVTSTEQLKKLLLPLTHSVLHVHDRLDQVVFLEGGQYVVRIRSESHSKRPDTPGRT